jgi:hypothetical protein
VLHFRQAEKQKVNREPISAKERRKARAMVRDISKQVDFFGRKAPADEWWTFLFAGAFGQEVVKNPIYQDLPDAPEFIVRNKKRTKDLTVSTAAEFITVLYAFGNRRGVEWSDPKWKAEMAAYEEQARRAA